METLVTQYSSSFPFAIMPGSGDGKKNFYYVSDGVIFKSFSFNTGSFLHIDGLNESLDLSEGKKLFIEIDVLPNLQPEKAKIRCEQVGKKDSWPTYPNMYEINPQDEIGEDGKVTKIVDGKTQKKCFILVGYRQDDLNKNEINKNEKIPDSATKAPVQILNNNIILLASIVSGVPVLFPMPFFNGDIHKKAIEGDFL